jgi:mono/diheme cytochrome c family protein
MKKVLFSCLMASVLTSCYYDKKELVYPTNNCDTLTTTYTKDIAPLMATNCTSCHSANNPSGGIMLDTYAETKNANFNNKLLNSVLQNGLASNMPQGAPKLSDCSLNKIQSWINKGMPE